MQIILNLRREEKSQNSKFKVQNSKLSLVLSELTSVVESPEPKFEPDVWRSLANEFWPGLLVEGYDGDIFAIS